MGDYLDVNGKSIVGSDIRSACGLGGELCTYFSWLDLLKVVQRSRSPSVQKRRL